LVFLTQRGNPWRTDELVIDAQSGKVVFNTETERPKVKRNQGIAHEFAKLMNRTGLRRHGRGFGTLRHTFRTWADEQHDQNAVDHIMGHELQGSRRSYIQRFELRRLRAVTDSVRAKLFG
jgi:integrase